MKKIILTNSKGGTGKTTSSAAIATLAAQSGARTLAVDFDPQANLSTVLGADLSTIGINEFMLGESFEDCTQQLADNLTVFTSSLDLKIVNGDVHRLKIALAPLEEKFDVCVIDTPPTIGDFQYSALIAADVAYIPLQASLLSIQALSQIYQTINSAKQINTTLKIGGCFVCQYYARPNIQRDMRAEIIEQAKSLGIPYLGEVRECSAVEAAQSSRQHLFTMYPKCNAALDYQAIFHYII